MDSLKWPLLALSSVSSAPRYFPWAVMILLFTEDHSEAGVKSWPFSLCGVQRGVDVPGGGKRNALLLQTDGAVLCPCKTWSWAWPALDLGPEPRQFLQANYSSGGWNASLLIWHILGGGLLSRLRPLLWWHHSRLLPPVHTWQAFLTIPPSESCFVFVWPRHDLRNLA